MKITAALVALAAAVAAPLASAQVVFPPTVTCSVSGTESASAQLLGNMTISNSMKRTTVKGGARLVQQIKVTNNNAATAEAILFTPYNSENTVSKGSARAPGGSKVTLAGDSTVFSNQAIVTTSVSSRVPSKVSIPAKKTLKATIAYKTPRCPGTGSATSKDFNFGPAIIATSFSCWKASATTPTTVKVENSKRC